MWLPLLVAVRLALPEPVQMNELAPFRFRAQEIDRSLKVGYAVIAADVNTDGRPDVVVADAQRVIWFENPTWKLRTIIQGHTKPDNVCLAAADIDGDGHVDFALGAGWKPFDTKSGGTLQWLQRGKFPEEPWTVHPIADNLPTLHRIGFGDLTGSGKPQLIVAPLMGRGSTAAKNWSEQPVEILSFAVPNNPTRERWTPQVLDRSLHVVHNLDVADVDGDRRMDLLLASYEGVTWLQTSATSRASRLSTGDQSRPDSNRGASEVRFGRLASATPYVATIEPWHGHQVVVYTPDTAGLSKPWRRHVLDDQLKWGHAVVCADLLRDRGTTLVIGVRDTLNRENPCGVRLYRPDSQGLRWGRELIDPGGVAVEDLTVADLNGDSRPEIIAVGRATRNVRIYWNESKP